MRRLPAICLLLVLLPVLASAQREAPIQWEEARWARLAGWPGLPQFTTARVVPMGDTLLFTAHYVGNPVSDTLFVCSSFNNGQTFTPWHRITDGSNRLAFRYTGSAGRYYGFFSQVDPSPPESCWVRMSSDGGLTWGPRYQQRHAGTMRGLATGPEILATYQAPIDNFWSYCVIRSTDYGLNWTPPLVIAPSDYYMAGGYQVIAFTKTHRILIESPLASDPYLYVASGDSSGQNWTPFELLSCSWYDRFVPQDNAAIIGDTACEAVGVASRFGTGDLWDRPVYFRSTNGGRDWEDCVMLTEEPRVILPFSTNFPLNVGQGKRWVTGWEHVVADTLWGDFLAIRFSANHGKNWYPRQFAVDSVSEAPNISGQVRGNQIDIYWDQLVPDAGQQICDYRMVRGFITPDTISPQVQVTLLAPDTLYAGDSVRFLATASDNDTLSEVRVILSESSAVPLTLQLSRVDSTVWTGAWVVPHGGIFGYRAEAEDFWEQVTSDPDSGDFTFETETGSAADLITRTPSSFCLSAFPNPFNATTQIRYSLPREVRVTLRIYDLIGREVTTLVDGKRIAAEHIETFDASGLPSGLYFARLQIEGFSRTQKILLVR